MSSCVGLLTPVNTVYIQIYPLFYALFQLYLFCLPKQMEAFIFEEGRMGAAAFSCLSLVVYAETCEQYTDTGPFWIDRIEEKVPMTQVRILYHVADHLHPSLVSISTQPN